LGACGYLAGVLLAELTIPGTPGRARSDVRRCAGATSTPTCRWLRCGGGGWRRAPPWRLWSPSPWSPLGWRSGAPVLATLLAGGVLVEAMLRRVPGRARPDPAELTTEVDDGYRAASARPALAAGCTLALTPISALASLAAGMLGGYCTTVEPASSTPLMWVMTVLAYAAAVG